ncbi:hypothetical protein D3C83_176100 [compost metagenome]
MTDIVSVGNVLEPLIVRGIFIFKVLALIEPYPTPVINAKPFGEDPDHRRDRGLAAPYKKTPPKRHMNKR